jgi:tRNA threonylcarbamoyl adenosine modification protein YeaZ
MIFPGLGIPPGRGLLAVAQRDDTLHACWLGPEGELSASQQVSRAQAGDLIGLIDTVLKTPAGTAVPAVVCFDAGPGSFTSLRLQASVAQSLAFGWGVPMVPVGSLLGQAVMSSGDEMIRPGERLLVAMDARLGEVYWQVFERQPEAMVGWQPTGSPKVDAVSVLLEILARDPRMRLAGDAFNRIGQLEHTLARHEFCASRSINLARIVGEIGLAMAAQGLAMAPTLAGLDYVRNKVALTQSEQIGQRKAVDA